MLVGESSGDRSMNVTTSNTTMSTTTRGLDFLDDVRPSNVVDNVTLSCHNDSVTSSTRGYNRHLLNVVLMLGIIAVLINMTIIVAILAARKRKLWKPVYILLANLAMADVCRGVSIVSTVATVFGSVCLDTSWATVTEIFRFFSVLYSVNSLLVLALERYWFILHGFSYESVFASRAKLTIFVLWTWLWSGAFSAVGIVTGKRCVSSNGLCALLIGPVCPHLLMGILVIVPAIFIISSNIATLCVVWRHLGFTTRYKAKGADSPPSVNLKTVITVIIIIVVVLFSWVPQFATAAMCNMDVNRGRNAGFGILFLAISSVVNPIIYSLRLKKVREAVIRLLPCNLQNKVDVW
ncbi:adrenocorticotropic hormone receptor-like isoform X1 [Branchiostoma lanceolatum]|uniref:adrenocorticotropic hormone receptor-like isoform X1 n=1 Tax=Branchiostoma lanceolatum TaxID=7740 RepID=UPI003454F851